MVAILGQARRILPGRGAARPGVTPYGNPLPRVIHQRVEHVKPGRLIIVGDLHGTPELWPLLEKLSYDKAVDNLILAGDIVNKGPVSLEILDAVPEELQALTVRGNHDDAVLAAWRQWRAAGGALPFNPKFSWAQAMTPQQAAVLEQMPFSVSVPQYGVAVVHAGLVPGLPLEAQDLHVLYKARDLVPLTQEEQARAEAEQGPASGVRFKAVEKSKEAGPGGGPWAAQWRGPPHVFFGHDARRGLQLHPAATGLDTGCVYGNALTAAVVPPLAELRARSPGFVAALAAGRAVTREELLLELVAVPAAEVYSKPDSAAAARRSAEGAKKAAAEAAAAEAAAAGAAAGAEAGVGAGAHGA
ncbi:hypothetical protein HYH03_006202 [Edaphochlamys debaryana]|uniref:Calcineurin-like phosphoesterase domain-containing protein n=1 Tax=Edaphochlamys debaryana TaxID=47281 RepID=A0A835Y331_9CHLO|nr:hypothetical protein HYH03_006202 [Edaphochlamys debaryana]|eukprot:KAG2495602.1 hypothetical protein HYH03_006202 [Edaphochlamys debaryana]